jgi:Ca2+-binding RTX toxin-like protein
MERPLLAAGLAGLACAVMAAASLAATETGAQGRDRLIGTKAGDWLDGRGGPDLLVGAKGNDVLLGGRGRDVLRGGPGRDGFNVDHGVALAAPGSDRIDARDGAPDEIYCGGGIDTAIVDFEEDGVYNCEQVLEP